jgi:hypothetical protein
MNVSPLGSIRFGADMLMHFSTSYLSRHLRMKVLRCFSISAASIPIKTRPSVLDRARIAYHARIAASGISP